MRQGGGAHGCACYDCAAGQEGSPQDGDMCTGRGWWLGMTYGLPVNAVAWRGLLHRARTTAWVDGLAAAPPTMISRASDASIGEEMAQ